MLVLHNTTRAVRALDALSAISSGSTFAGIAGALASKTIKTPNCKSELDCEKIQKDDPKGRYGKEHCQAAAAETLRKTGSVVQAEYCFADCAEKYALCYIDEGISEKATTKV